MRRWRREITTATCVLTALLAGPAHAAPSPDARARPDAQSGDGEAAMLARAWRGRAVTRDSRHYTITTDLPLERAERFARHLDACFDAYAQVVRGLRVRNRIALQAMFFARPEDYRAVLGHEFDADVGGTAGVAVTRGARSTIAVYLGPGGVPAFERTLRHEAFHQFARALLPGLPPWLNEGLAELFERGLFLDGRLILGEVPEGDLARLRRYAAEGALVPFADLFRRDARSWMGHVNLGSSRAAYPQAWLMVHYLVFGEGGNRRGAFTRCLGAINRGSTWRSAFVDAFGVDLAAPTAFEQAWLAYLRAVPPTDYRETVRRIEFLAAGLADLARRGEEPRTLDALRAALVAAGFEHRCTRFGEPIVLHADRDSLYRVPFADRVEGSGPVFELVPAASAKDRRRRPRRKDGDQASGPTMDVAVRRSWPVRWRVVWERGKDGTSAPRTTAKW